ncbi:hypothetical protein Bca101_009229 [Brassica carinata]
MKNEFGISPGTEHYLVVLDVLGKCGHLVKAEQYICGLPFEATADFWEAMRNYGRLHGDIELEDYAEELMVELDPSKAVTNKIPTPPPKSYRETSMLARMKLRRWMQRRERFMFHTRNVICTTLTRRLNNRHCSTTVRG